MACFLVLTGKQRLQTVEKVGKRSENTKWIKKKKHLSNKCKLTPHKLYALMLRECNQTSKHPFGRWEAVRLPWKLSPTVGGFTVTSCFSNCGHRLSVNYDEHLFK